jgi:D-arabinitol dehydrogenase (NADP+)
MKAVEYDAPRSFTVTDVPTPQPGPGQVRIAVAQVGVCGTDLHLHDGGFGAVYPLIPGHEVVGVVDQLGEGVTRFALGEQVTVNPNIHCGYCDYCLAGRVILCTDGRGLGSTGVGFFAEYACVDHDLVFSVEGLPRDTAMFTEPAACAMHGVERLTVRPGSSALVFGAGPTGLLLAQLLTRSGAASVTVADLVPFKLDTATRLGIDHTVRLDCGDPSHNIQALRDVSPTGDGYDIVVEATGVPAVGETCVPLARRGGTVLVYGVTHDDDVLRIHPFDVFRREITILGSFAEATSFGATIATLRSGRVRTDGLITHRFTLDDYGKALETLATDPTAHKVMITVS